MTGVSSHTVCWLVRHGQTAWNREGRYLSRSDLELTPFGRRQAEAVGQRLKRQPISVVVHSGMRQTEETTAAIIAGLACSPRVEPDTSWREGDHGRWEGQSYPTVLERYPCEAQARFADPFNAAPEGGESLTAVRERILAAWHALLARHGGGRILLVTHATPIQFVVCAVLGLEHSRYWQLRVDLGSVTAFDLYPSAAIIRALNETPRFVKER